MSQGSVFSINFCDVIKKVYEIVLPNKGGNNADYIPTLARVDPEQFSISFCSVDGQV